MINKCSAIPKGYHSTTPYIAVNSAFKAIEFYEIQKQAHTEGARLKKLTLHDD